MILSDRSIKEALEAGRIVIDPLGEGCIQPASVDLRLGTNFKVFKHSRYAVIDPHTTQPEMMEDIEATPDKPFVLQPGEFALGTTFERIAVPNDLLGHLEGKSTLGRLGLMIHSTAGYVDPGWDGYLTLELSNVAPMPILLYPGMRIGQISFTQMTTEVDIPYGDPRLKSHYQGQVGATVSHPLNHTEHSS